MRLVGAVMVGALVLLAGCADLEKERARRLDALVGQPRTELLRQYGAPDRVYEDGERTFFTYITTSMHSMSTYPDIGYGWYGGPWGLGAAAADNYYYTTSCRVNFELVKGRVVGWSLKGEGGC